MAIYFCPAIAIPLTATSGTSVTTASGAIRKGNPARVRRDRPLAPHLRPWRGPLPGDRVNLDKGGSQ